MKKFYYAVTNGNQILQHGLVPAQDRFEARKCLMKILPKTLLRLIFTDQCDVALHISESVLA